MDRGLPLLVESTVRVATSKAAPKRRPVSRRKPAAAAIDRDKLRTAIRRLDDEQVFYMLDHAIDLLPPAKLMKLVSPYLDVKRLRPDAPGSRNLLAEARAFERCYCARSELA